jgi:acid stress-induced BolA-like protein IbaG/YrbA
MKDESETRVAMGSGAIRPAVEPLSFLRQRISITMASSHFNVISRSTSDSDRTGIQRAAGPTYRMEHFPMDSSRIQAMIEQGLPGAQVEVSGADGVHFEATVVASQFAGKLPLARHRLVYATLGELMGGAIHALALTTLTPEEVAARR